MGSFCCGFIALAMSANCVDLTKYPIKESLKNLTEINARQADQIETNQEYIIQGFPTFDLFKKGRIFEYNRPREKSSAIDVMKGQLKTPSEKNRIDRDVGFFSKESDSGYVPIRDYQEFKLH